MGAVHIGIDLDNTIINYEDVFAPVAKEMGLLPPTYAGASKNEVKASLRADGGEEAWMRLQGQIYGRHIGRAKPYPGFDAFLRSAFAKGARISIVSHKTRHGHFDRERVDLWSAARGWLEHAGYLSGQGAHIKADDVHFLETRDAKINRIASLGCAMFVDDLPEVLLDPGFPQEVEKLWFAYVQPSEHGEGLVPLRSWAEIMDKVLSKF